MINTEVIKQFEGLRLKPYLCSANVPTIGYGNTFYDDGKKVTMKDAAITQQKAQELLDWYIETYVVTVINKYIKVELNDNQLSALASFLYNIGEPNFKASTLVKKVNKNPEDLTIADEFAKWNKAAGKIVKGLTNRRKMESELYFK